MIKAIIYDFFDVFRTDAYKAWLAANNIPHEGGYFEASRQQDLGNITTEQFLERLSQLSGRPITKAEIDATATVDDEMVALAATLHPRYRHALLSNAPSAFIRELLATHDLARHFDEIVVSSEVGLVKPSPEIFELTLSRLGVGAAEAIFIDDNPGHTQAAEAIGLRSFQFTSATKLRQDLVAAGLELSSKTSSV